MTASEKAYKNWLIEKLNTRKEDYSFLLESLYNIEYFAVIKYDEDRGSDGLMIREEWSLFEDVDVDIADFGVANVLEVLLGIAKRIEFQLFGTQYYDEWNDVAIFWDLVENLGLCDTFCDTFAKICHIVTLFMDREQKRHKKCHIFKYKNPPKNLYRLDLWVQMGLYIRERWPSY